MVHFFGGEPVAERRRGGAEGMAESIQRSSYNPSGCNLSPCHRRRLATSTCVTLSLGHSANSTGTLSAIKGSRPSKHHYLIITALHAMAPPNGWYHIQTPTGNNVVRPEKLGDQLFIAALDSSDWNQMVS
jgi:hypothetical protein